jgi:hypothetical protein
MFGFSLQKLLVLAALIGAAWYGFKLIGRWQEGREVSEAKRPRAGGRAAAEEVEEMVECPRCGAFVAKRGAQPCERDDCPY